VKLTRCKEGHYYDKKKHRTCPYCGIDINVDLFTSKIKYKDDDPLKTEAREETSFQKSCLNESENPTVAKCEKFQNQDEVVTVARSTKDDENKTISLYRKSEKLHAGWLVCIEGALYSKEYNIQNGRNFIGNDIKFDIFIDDDKNGKELYAEIVFDYKNCDFAIINRDSVKITVNGESLNGHKILASRDIIEIDENKFIFIPLCGSDFKW
jgi:hypothetical protein